MRRQARREIGRSTFPPSAKLVQCGMFLWILAFVAFMIAFTLLYRLAVIRLSRKVGGNVETNHREAQHVLSTRKPPPAWLADVAKRHAGAGSVNAGSQVGERARRDLVSRLEKLTGYFRRSPVVADDESREEIVGSLEEIRDEWQAADPAEILRGPEE